MERTRVVSDQYAAATTNRSKEESFISLIVPSSLSSSTPLSPSSTLPTLTDLRMKEVSGSGRKLARGEACWVSNDNFKHPRIPNNSAVMENLWYPRIRGRTGVEATNRSYWELLKESRTNALGSNPDDIFLNAMKRNDPHWSTFQ